MISDREFELAVAEWLNAGSDATPPSVTDAVLLAARSTPQERSRRMSWRPSPMRRLPYAVATLAVLVVGVTALFASRPLLGVGWGPTPSAEPSVGLGIFKPVAGRIVYGFAGGIIGVDPAAPSDLATRIQLTSVAGVPLGWSSDGTRLLIMRGETWGLRRLFVVQADGSETEVTTDPIEIKQATMSPDGSRVVFHGGTGEFDVYAVDADGGPAEGLIKGTVWALAFSPDGTRIAYVMGAGDNGHSVWLMNADGSGAHQILANETTLGAGHVHGLAWSPAGDRLALGLGPIYTFAPDGSGFTRIVAEGDVPSWSPDGSQVAYEIPCDRPESARIQAPECGLAIVDADGSNLRAFGFGTSGPWHPGKLGNGSGR